MLDHGFEVVQINYWKELGREIQTTVGEMHGLVLLTHNSVEFSDIVQFLNKIRKKEQQTVLYISLVNSFKHIKNTLEVTPLINKRLFVVDCVSGFVIELQDSVDCVYRKPPSNLEKMKEMIMSNIRLVNPNMIVVDSLSQFINFSVPRDAELHELYKFLKNIKEDALGITNDTILLLYDDKMGSMKKLPTIFANLIIKLEVIKEKIQWED
jgi:hypothetical protein